MISDQPPAVIYVADASTAPVMIMLMNASTSNLADSKPAQDDKESYEDKKVRMNRFENSLPGRILIGITYLVLAIPVILVIGFIRKNKNDIWY